MIDLNRDGNVFTLVMNDFENRWNTTFVRAFAEAIDEIEASDGPAALVTTSANEKFFSNGLDLNWISSDNPSDDDAGGDRAAFGPEFMTLMSRIITLSVPSIAAINGHAFGAGFMLAMSHDQRIMREDRGFVCANEMQLGMIIPQPELALFRHKLPANTFFETVQLARRWTGPTALGAGIVQQTAGVEDLLDTARARAEELAPLGANRKIFKAQKESMYGENAALNDVHGAAFMLRNSDRYHHAKVRE